ncbi:MAG: putative ABC transporter permease [Clostridia bacterium]|nr:putative ABC transporter permease [Clostridia bacterium]
MLPSYIAVVFMLFSALGWLYECLFCTLTSGKWENRGFLFGPVCPIYGTGAAAVLLIRRAVLAAGPDLAVWQVFLLCAAGSAVLEYVTSLVLEKLFHALWWDYSGWPLNLNGRISLFTSVGFGGAGVLIWYVLLPLAERLLGGAGPVLMELLSLGLLAVLVCDLTLTVNTLLHFDRLVTHAEDAFNRGMDAVVESTKSHTVRLKDGLASRQKAFADRLGLMGRPALAAIRRVRRFNYRDAARDRAEALLSAVSRLRRR